MNQNVNLPNKRPLFIGGVIAAALLFIGVTWALAARSTSTRRRSG